MIWQPYQNYKYFSHDLEEVRAMDSYHDSFPEVAGGEISSMMSKTILSRYSPRYNMSRRSSIVNILARPRPVCNQSAN